jgi:hypothetical protein
MVSTLSEFDFDDAGDGEDIIDCLLVFVGGCCNDMCIALRLY